MSKSLGNSPDPLDLIDQYGADGVRTGMLFSSPAGNDLLFDIKLCEQGRNFSNKIWNAFRLLNSWEVAPGHHEDQEIAVKWFEARFNKALNELEDHFEKYRISDALMTVYKLIWGDFCSWYLEIIKPTYGEKIDQVTFDRTIVFFEELMKILHPFMPFISEELWNLIRSRDKNDLLIVASWPEIKSYDEQLITEGEKAFEIISNIRNIRSSKGISPKESLGCQVKTDHPELFKPFLPVINKLANLEKFEFSETLDHSGSKFVVGADEFLVPLSDNVNTEEEKNKLQQELKYAQGFLASVNKKLENEKFVNNAPDKVIEMERKKKADAEAKIKALEASLSAL
jgi:valyl-tRNA synthetase